MNSKRITDLVHLNKSFILEGLAHAPSSEENFFVDWTGVIYPDDSFPTLPKETLMNLNPLLDGDGFRAGVNEWIAFGLAAKITLAQSSSATIVELGASQGLWCIPWVKYFNRVSPSTEVIALGFEAGDAGKETLRFWKANRDLEFSEIIGVNELILKGNHWQFHWLRRAVSDKNGKYWFPRVDITKDNGKGISSVSGNDLEIFDEVEAITPNDIVQKLAKLNSENISLLHLDLQGAESQLLESDEFHSLCMISNIIVLGTHSSEIELKAHLRLRSTHTLIISEPCVYIYEMNRRCLIKDGEQIWVNNQLLHFAIKISLLNENSGFTEESIANYGYRLTQVRDNLAEEFYSFQTNQNSNLREISKNLIKKSLIEFLRRLQILRIVRKIWIAIH